MKSNVISRCVVPVKIKCSKSKKELSTRENLPVGDENIATPDKVKDWKYLERIADKIIPGKDISVGFLISVNCSKDWNHQK